MRMPPSGITFANYRDAIYAGNKSHVRITFANGTVLDDQDIESKGFVLRDIINGDTNLTFGKAVMQELTIPLLNSSRLDNVNWTEEFTLEMGVEMPTTVDNETVMETKWVTIGHFQGQRPDKVHYVDVIDFTAYDRMQWFETPASRVAEWLDQNNYWPVTMRTLYAVMCTQIVGIEYVELSTSTYPITTGKQFNRGDINFEGLTCRDMLALIGEAVGCYATINSNGKVLFKWYGNNGSINIDPDMEFSVEAADIEAGMTYTQAEAKTYTELEAYTWNDLGGYQTVYGIDGLDVKTTEDDIGVHYGNVVGNLYQIIDNPFLTIKNNTDADNYILPIWDRLQEFGGHLPVRVECVGNWLVQSGDILNVRVYPNQNRVKMPVYSQELHWNGYHTVVYECTGDIQRPVFSVSSKQKLTNGAMYHKFRNEIDELYSEVGDTNGNVSVLQQRANGIELSVANKYDRKSGVEIDENGVTITGSSKVNINSGGSFDVDATNFKISSEDKKVVAGVATIDEYGLVIKDTDSSVRNNFYLGSFTRPKTQVDDANYGMYLEANYNRLRLILKDFINTGYKYLLEFAFTHVTAIGTKPETVTMMSTDTNIDIGTGDYPVRSIHSTNLGDSAFPITNAWITNLVQGSSRDVKHDIEPMPDIGEKLDQLKPVTFVYDNDGTDKKRFGLIHEDTIRVLPEICIGDETSKAEDKGINYLELAPMLLKEVQELRKRVTYLENRVSELEGNK